jgi:hypothetical protein
VLLVGADDGFGAVFSHDGPLMSLGCGVVSGGAWWHPVVV